MTDEQLSEIRARAEAATPGPWKFNSFPLGEGLAILEERFNGQTVIDDGSACGENRESTTIENMTFFLHCRQDIPALLNHIEEQGRQLSCFGECIDAIASAHDTLLTIMDIMEQNSICAEKVADINRLADKIHNVHTTISDYVDQEMHALLVSTQRTEIEHLRRVVAFLADEAAEPPCGCGSVCPYPHMPQDKRCPRWKNDGNAELDDDTPLEEWKISVFGDAINGDGEPLNCATRPSKCWYDLAIEKGKERETPCQK